jgi:DNA repair exonuclease SbcCD nuclease subunit
MTQPDDTSGSFCFVHAADLHLDTPFKGIGQTAPLIAQALREASLDAFDDLVAVCLERRAAFLVLAGDIYDGADRGIRAQLRFRDGLGRLSDAGIYTLVVHGNHDPVESGWSAIGTWPPLVTIFGTESVEAVPVVRDGCQIAVVHGISYWRRDVRENLALRFARSGGPGFEVGVLHCNVTAAADGHEDYSPCSLDDLGRAGLDYWALGHIHTSMVLSGRPHADEPWVVYPGNLQARSTKASESGAKGAMVVDVVDGRVGGIEFVACDRIRYVTVDIDVSALGSIDAVRDVLADAGHDALDGADDRSVVLRARLCGRSDVHAMLHHDRVLAELLESLRDEFPLQQPWCWWDRIDDASAPTIDVEELKAGSDFAADLITMSHDLLRRCSTPALALGLDAELPTDLLEDITSTLPRALRARLLASHMSASELIEAGLTTALDELGAGSDLAPTGHLT